VLTGPGKLTCFASGASSAILFILFNLPAFAHRGVCTNIGGPDHLSDNAWVKDWGGDGRYDYKAFIDWLAKFKITHLNVWLFELAFGIAFSSKKFPECVNHHHPNVKHEFMTDLIDYAHERHIEVTAFIDFPDMAAGIINGLGSIGPILQEPVIGWLKTYHGLSSVLILLVGMTVLATVGTAILWLAVRKYRLPL